MPAASLRSGGYASVGSLYHPARALTHSDNTSEAETRTSITRAVSTRRGGKQYTEYVTKRVYIFCFRASAVTV